MYLGKQISIRYQTANEGGWKMLCGNLNRYRSTEVKNDSWLIEILFLSGCLYAETKNKLMYSVLNASAGTASSSSLASRLKLCVAL